MKNGCPLLGGGTVRAGARLFRFRQLPGWAPGGAIAPSPNRALVSRGARELPGAARRPRLLLPMDAFSEKRVPGRHSCLLVCYKPLARQLDSSKKLRLARRNVFIYHFVWVAVIAALACFDCYTTRGKNRALQSCTLH